MEKNQLKILVVDDNADTVSVTCEVLALHGHKCWAASSGEHALLEARRTLPDVAFIDIGMPNLDGYELAGLLRAIPGGSKMSLVAYTGYSSATIQPQAIKCGFTCVLQKPASIEEILDLVSELARDHQLA